MIARGQHDDGVRLARRAKVGALERIDGDIHRRVLCGFYRATASADFFADEEHRRFVALAFADHDGAVHADRIHLGAHRFDGRLIGPVAVAQSHGAGRSDGRPLHDAQEFKA